MGDSSISLFSQQALNPLQVEIIHLVHTQSFPKNKNLLPPDMHTDLWVSGDKKC